MASITLKSFPFDSMDVLNSESEKMEPDRLYEAEVFRRYFAKFLSNGVYYGNYKNYGENGMKVSANGGLNIKVNAGAGIIEGADFENEEDTIFTLERPTSGNRVDRVVVKLDKTLAVRETQLYVKSGNGTTPATLQRDDNIYEICLAEVTVKSSSNIEQSDVVDKRANTTLCGIVNSLISVDGEELYQKFQQYIENIKSNLVLKNQDNIITGKLTVNGGVEGNVTGDVTGNVSGSSGSCTGTAENSKKLGEKEASDYLLKETVETNSLINKNKLGANTDIKTLEEAGIYICSNPTTAKGYPTTEPGVLEVIKSSETSGHVIQRYSVDGSNVTYERHIGEEVGSWVKIINSGDFAVLTGTITMPKADSDILTGNVEVNYPKGFTKDNCVVVSLMSHNIVYTDYWSTSGGQVANSMATMLGNATTATLKPSAIRIAAHKAAAAEAQKDVTYKVVLMKIS